jgi:hypothetical protein
MDGFKTLATDTVDLLLIILAFVKEIVLAIWGTTDFALCLKYIYDGLNGTNSWLGFAVASIFYLTEDDEEVSSEFCEFAGSLFTIVDSLHVLVSFSDAS